MSRFEAGRSLEQKASLTVIEQHRAQAPSGEITPYTVERLATTDTQTAIIIAKGWTAPPQAYNQFQHELAVATELPVISYENTCPKAHGVPLVLNPKRAGEDLVQNIHTVSHDAMRRLGYRRFIMFGHSLGGAISVNYAHRYGENIDGLVLGAPAGLMNRDSIAAAAKRALFDHPTKHEVGELIKKPMFELQLAKYGATHIVRHLGRTAAEGIFAASEKTTDKLQELSYDGIPVTVLTFSDDLIFSATRIKEGLEGLPNVACQDLNEMCHNAPVHVPQKVAPIVGRIALNMSPAA